MNYRISVPKLPGIGRAATEALSEVLATTGKRTTGENKANILASLKVILSHMGEASAFKDFRHGDEPLIEDMNSRITGIASDIKSSIASITQLELNQLQEFNMTEQRVADIDGRLDGLEKVLEKLQAQRKDGANEVVVISETFKDLDIADPEAKGDGTIPSHNPMGGFITLTELTNSAAAINSSSVNVEIDNVNHAAIEYPNSTERPTGVFHEGHYYGFPGESKAEGGKWEITLEEVSDLRPDELAAAHDPVSYLFRDDPLEDILPPEAGVEPSHLRAINKGPSPSARKAMRNLMFDGNPESVWECEVVSIVGGNKADLTPAEAKELKVDGIPGSRLEVSFIIDLGTRIKLSKLGIMPNISAKYSNMTVMSIETSERDKSSFVPISGVGDRAAHAGGLDGLQSQNKFAWTFTPRDVRYIRVTIQETTVEITPYPVTTVNFSRGITYEGVETFVPKDVIGGSATVIGGQNA